MSKRDYYEILGLAKNSSDDEIKKSYRQLASKYHPDKITGDDNSPEKKQAEEKFKEVREAYETLSDVEKRNQYDMHGHNASAFNHGFQHPHQQHPAEFDDLLRSFFSGGRFNDGMFGQPQKQQVIHVVNISLNDAYIGKTIKVDSTVTINIPKGARSGTKFFVDNKLYRIDILPHQKFKRANDDLLIDVDVSTIEAMLGVDVELAHLDGGKLQFKIPPGIQPNQIVKLASKGMKNPETDKQGDIMVRINITVPKLLTELEKVALRSISHRTTINV